MKGQKPERIIGIDPDVDKSGVAELHTPTGRLEATTLCFPDLMDYLRHIKANFSDKGEKVLVIVEAGWMNATNWHKLAHGQGAQHSRSRQDRAEHGAQPRGGAQDSRDVKALRDRDQRGQAAPQVLERGGRQDNARRAGKPAGGERDNAAYGEDEPRGSRCRAAIRVPFGYSGKDEIKINLFFSFGISGKGRIFAASYIFNRQT